MPRKTKVNDDLIKNVSECIRLGMSYAATAGAVGVTPESFQNWLRWGAEGKPPYSALLCAVRTAESQLMFDCLTKLKTSADLGNIESVKWLLERRFGEFSKQNSLNVKAQMESVNVNLNPDLQHEDVEKIRMKILEKLSRPTHPPGLEQSSQDL